MADDQVTVELVAKVDALTSGLTEAVNAMREAVEAIKDNTEKLKDDAEETNETLKKILSGEYFIIFKEVATEALEAVKGAFESTVGAAEEFGLSNAKFAALMGTSEEKAAGLSAALHGVGISTEQYEGMALRLEMRLNTNEKGMQEMGIATRDASGHLLSGQELMDSALTTMRSYKDGTDQNAFALEVFGRKAADVYDLMRVGDESVEHQIAIYKEMGVNLEGTGQSSQQLEDALNDLHTMITAVGIRLGQDFMPMVQFAIKWLGENGPPLIRQLIDALEELFDKAVKGAGKLMETIDHMGRKFEFMTTIHIPFESFEHWEKRVYGVGEAADQAQSAYAKLIATVVQFGETVAGQAEFGDHGESLGVNYKGGEKNPYKSGGTRAFKAPSKGKDNSEDEAIQAAEKLAEAEISIEESTNAHLLAMGQEELEQFVSQARQLENEKYSVKLDALNKELALPGRTKAEIQKTNDEVELLDVTHAGALVKIEQDAASRKAAAARASLTEFIKVDDDKLKSGIDAIKALEDAGKLGSLAAGEQEAALTVQIRQEQLARLDAEMATMSKTSAEYKKLNAEKAKLEHEFTQALVADQKQAASALAADMKTGLAPVLGGFNTAINEMIEKGKSFHQAMQDMWKSILSGFLSMIERMAEEWAIKQIANAVVAQTSISTSARLQIAAEAALASAAAFASTAAIPIVGLAAAPGAGATAYGEVMAMQGLVPAAAGGMLLNRDQLVYAHKDEQILPAHLSKGIQDMISRGSGAGGDITLNYNGVANGGGDLPTLLRKHSDAMAAWIHQARRDGKI
jgi:hypothetical protein